MLPKEPIVVKDENSTAFGVVVTMISEMWRFCLSRITICMLPAIPSPNNSGKTMTFAKLNGKENMTDAELVINAAITKGANISMISLSLFVNDSTRIPINNTVVIPAWINASTTVFPASYIETGAPVACGEIFCTSFTKLIKAEKLKK